MSYNMENGIYNLDFALSKIEKKLFDEFSDMLEKKGFQYLSIPTSISWDTFLKQGAVANTLSYDEHVLGGSAEQGILEYFSNKEVNLMKIYAKNTCFRKEEQYRDAIRLKEFIKLEQFCFCNENQWEENFELLLTNATNFLTEKDIKHRVIDVTKKDSGYHIRKYDIEIYSVKHGWVESHSCSYFGTNQSERFNITGANHTISNTGLASPRILIPYIESKEKTNNELMN